MLITIKFKLTLREEIEIHITNLGRFISNVRFWIGYFFISIGIRFQLSVCFLLFTTLKFASDPPLKGLMPQDANWNIKDKHISKRDKKSFQLTQWPYSCGVYQILNSYLYPTPVGNPYLWKWPGTTLAPVDRRNLGIEIPYPPVDRTDTHL